MGLMPFFSLFLVILQDWAIYFVLCWVVVVVALLLQLFFYWRWIILKHTRWGTEKPNSKETEYDNGDWRNASKGWMNKIKVKKRKNNNHQTETPIDESVIRSRAQFKQFSVLYYFDYVLETMYFGMEVSALTVQLKNELSVMWWNGLMPHSLQQDIHHPRQKPIAAYVWYQHLFHSNGELLFLFFFHTFFIYSTKKILKNFMVSRASL